MHFAAFGSLFKRKKYETMKKALGILGAFLLTLSSPSDLGAATEWRTVFFEDFGGNNSADPPTGPKLSSERVGENLVFIARPNTVGAYYLVKHSDSNGQNWHWGGDHTNLNDTTKGYYMRIDPPGSNADDVMYRQKITGICEGVKFKFKAWISTLSLNVNDEKPKVSLGIFEDSQAQRKVSDGAYVKSYLTSSPDPNSMNLNWEPIEIEFEVSAGIEEAYFIVSAFEATPYGCDFAIDDISVEVEQPIVTITSTEFIKDEPAKLMANFDNNGFFANPDEVVYKWQYRKDINSAFTDIAGSEGRWKSDNQCSYTINSFDKDVNNGDYRVVIGESGTLDNSICSVQKDYTIQETGNKINVTLCKSDTARWIVLDETTGQGYKVNASKLFTGQKFTVPGTDYTAVYTIIEPDTVVRQDTFLCIGSTINGKVYDKAQTVTVDSAIKSQTPGCDCDSILFTQKYVVTDSTVKNRDAVHLCQGGMFNGKTFHEAGEFKDLKEDGCIQFVTPVFVHPVYEVDYTYAVCQGQSFAGERYNESGSFAKTLRYTSEYGCDSVINATIDVKGQISVTLEDVEMCEGSDVYTFNGKIYSKADVYELSDTTESVVSGCDSVTNVRVVIHPRYNNKENPIDTMICYDSKLFGVVYPEPTTTPILVRDPTTYTSVNGCDSIIYYNVEVLKIQLKLEISSDKNTVCNGEEVEIFVKDLKPINTPLMWIPDLGGASANRKNFTPTEDMICVVRARNDVAQCETTDTARIYVKPSPSIAIDTLDEKNNIVNYSVTSGTEPFHIYLNKNEVSMEPVGEIKNSPIGTHKLMVRDSSDCMSSVTYDIKPVPITPSEFMTPNNDGENDVWTIENIDVYPLSRVRIYDRDGRLLVEYEAYNNNEGFDGTYMGRPLPSTDYWYEIDLVEADRQYVGHFTLIR